MHEIAAFGTQLIEAHQWLREELARLREDLGAGGRPADLRAHCLAFCSALTRHHTGEDAVAFPALAERHPELRPVLAQLEEDHQLVADILRRISALDGSDPKAALAELDGLTAIMESHFAFEERKIVAALDALDLPEWRPYLEPTP
ncbi:hemerythrin domain-containing protein [Nonomuraea typhae]|uniref:hemerythrin domain-containing protein n=1 Tax=Nonomuraea typhae TaxID=2603600 RepID=UPI0012FBFBF0|nr:hemerythrin domain-containing protein [Nonomuraea typhae]